MALPMSLQTASPARTESAENEAPVVPAAEPSRAVVARAYVVLAAVAVLLLLLMKGRPPIGDEAVHARQVDAMLRWLAEGEPFVPVHPALPGYHQIGRAHV